MYGLTNRNLSLPRLWTLYWKQGLTLLPVEDINLQQIFDTESGKALLREWKLPETLRGVGAIALGYPAQEAGQPAARKQNYIVRI